MANVKLSALTELTAKAGADILGIIDDPAGSPLSRKITVTNLCHWGFGEIYLSGGATGTGALTPSTWTLLTLFAANGEAVNTTPDHTADDIDATNAGIYQILFSATFTTDGTAQVDFAPFVNASQTQIIGSVDCVTTTVYNVAGSGFYDISTAGWDVDLRVRADAAVDVTVTDMNLSILRVS